MVTTLVKLEKDKASSVRKMKNSERRNTLCALRLWDVEKRSNRFLERTVRAH